ncbi:MAG: hypothetical protein A2X94_10320 [Bdellovibrionales bacterium GWB1_55_8]|nr:MAG: hypothetical protein A2X94_10320 [Bdellovibrionales bacterium GWB1_55_8]
MKTFDKTVLAAIGLFFGTIPAFAGAGHDHGHKGHSHGAAAASESRIVELATAEVKGLVKKQKLESSWDKVAVKNVSRAGTLKHWVVQYENAAIKDASKSNLYVILTPEGTVKAVNFKGIEKPHSHGSGAPHVH